MDNQKVKKEKALPNQNKEERQDAIRRSKTHCMLSKCSIVKYVILSIV